MGSGGDERGTITIWVLGLTVAVLFLGGIGLDLWRAVAVRRELSAMADAAATAGANGLDEPALRGGRLQLDDARARALVANELAQYTEASKVDRAQVTATATSVAVTLREDVRFSLLSIFMGGGHFTTQVTATAEPRELP